MSAHLMHMLEPFHQIQMAIQRMALNHTSSSFRGRQAPDALTDILPVYLLSLLSRKRTRVFRDESWSASTVYWKAEENNRSFLHFMSDFNSDSQNVKQRIESYISHDSNV